MQDCNTSMTNTIYNPNLVFNVAIDWSVKDQTFPIRIATIPALCTDSDNFAFKEDYDLSEYDLVLVSDIEMQTVQKIQDWAKRKNIKRYLAAVGAKHDHEVLPPNFIYRPWWCYNFISLNEYQNTDGEKPFLFDMLLGARRPHRDYMMLAFQHYNLLDSSIVNYRDIFNGNVIDRQTQWMQGMFPEPLKFPYVSPNLDPAWEVKSELDNSISSLAPWEIYRRTHYTVACETIGSGGCFFMSEKTTKAMLAKRLVIPIGTQHLIKNMRDLGFAFWDNIIDMSWDNVALDVKRYELAAEQINRLSKMDPAWVNEQTREIREHNHNQLYKLRSITQAKMASMLNGAIESVLATSH